MIEHLSTLSTMAAAKPLPQPHAAYTLPTAIALVVLAALFVIRKIIKLAVAALVVTVLVLAYQAGAFDHFVDKGKSEVHKLQQRTTG